MTDYTWSVYMQKRRLLTWRSAWGRSVLSANCSLLPIKNKSNLSFFNYLIHLRDNNSNSNGVNKLLNLLDVSCPIQNHQLIFKKNPNSRPNLESSGFVENHLKMNYNTRDKALS